MKVVSGYPPLPQALAQVASQASPPSRNAVHRNQRQRSIPAERRGQRRFGQPQSQAAPYRAEGDNLAPDFSAKAQRQPAANEARTDVAQDVSARLG